MTEHRTRIVIVGGGLAGLYAAYLLKQRGVDDYVLLESRDVWGGRIASIPPAEDKPSDRFDLGPTWFWPEYQPQLDRLIQSLGLQRFAQYEAGDMVIEQGWNHVPTRVRGYASMPPSVRLVGGMSALIDALRQGLNTQNLVLWQRVQRIRSDGSSVVVDAEAVSSHVSSYAAEHVLLAMPK